MKLLRVVVHFEYGDAVEGMLDRHGVEHFVRYPRMEGKDAEGKHFGSQVFPGSVSVLEAQVAEEKLEALLEELARFRAARPAHGHLEALVLPVERRL